MRALLLIILAMGPAARAQSSDELRDLMRRVLSNLQSADRDLGDYVYDRFSVRREFDGNGELKRERTILARRTFWEGFGFTQQVERDGRPVPAQDLAREREAFETRIAEIEAMTPVERRKREEENRKEWEERNSWLTEFPDALDYRKVGEESVGGRVALVLECSPRSGYKAKTLQARVFEKVRGTLWIDKAELQLVRADAEVFETVNIGWGVLGRIRKGTKFHIERQKLGDGTWLPGEQTVRFAARVLLFKTIFQEEITRYSAYRHKSAEVAFR